MTPDSLPSVGVSSGLRRWLAPPFTAIIFLIPPLVSLLAPDGQFQDPGTGWHLATGRYILATHSIPHRDVFSFTASGRPWITYYWLFDMTGAFLERLGGLPLYASACVLVYAFVPVLLYRRMVRMGTAIVPALALTLVAYLVLISHSLARPHVFTYLLFAFFLERLDDVHAGRRPVRSLWMLPPLATAWCNVHGGFMAGLALVGIYAGVAGLRAVAFRERSEWREALAFGVLLLVMAAATLVNPNGARLHADILHHLAMKTTGKFLEFRSPDFQAPMYPVHFFEILVLTAFLVAALARKRLAWVELALLLFFLHEALHSVRHMNLFAIVAAPLVARELTVPLAARWPHFAVRWRQIAAEQAALKAPLLYIPAICVLFVGLSVAGVLGFPRTLDDIRLSRGAAEFITAHPSRFARPFNTDDLGGTLIYRFWPTLRVFIDDRIYVYGDDFVMRYFAVFYAERRWQKVLDKYRVTAAVTPSDAQCATVLRASREWKLVYEDHLSTIFFRRAGRVSARAASSGNLRPARLPAP